MGEVGCWDNRHCCLRQGVCFYTVSVANSEARLIEAGGSCPISKQEMLLCSISCKHGPRVARPKR